MRRALATLAFVLLALGCGDGTVVLRVSFGTIVGDPSCSGSDGTFDLRGQDGLVLIVVIDHQTTIFLAGGAPGTCRDLVDGTQVEVHGSRQGGRIEARDVFVTS